MVNKVNDVIREINDLTKVTIDGDNVSAPKISDYELKELKIRLQKLFEPLLTDENAAPYNIIDYNKDDGTIILNKANLEKFLQEKPQEDWDVLYTVVENAKELSNIATNEAYVAPLLNSYQNEERRLEEEIMDYQEYLQEKQDFLKQRFASIETYIAGLQSVQTKINSILTAQMLIK